MIRYGLIGFPLSHSFSEEYFANKFRRENVADCVYQNFPLENIGQLMPLLATTPDLKGFNITIPYKEHILPLLHKSDSIVKAIGACNCVKVDSGTLIGYNTDAIGFEKSFRPHLQSHHTRALILGEGGAAKAVAYVLEKLSIEYLYVVRKGVSGKRKLLFGELSEAITNSYPVIINSTPLGMYPHTDESPPINYEALGSGHYLYDLIYNPAETIFLKQGKSRGAFVKNGHEMLVLQAEESWNIWNSNL